MKTKISGKLLYLPIICVIILMQFSTQTLVAQKYQYTISGRISAADNGAPLQASILLYMSTMENGTEFVPMDKAAADVDGNYTFTEKVGYNYKLQVYSWDNNYNSAFYENSENLEGATVIVLNKDYTDVNVALTHKRVYDNGIHGVVLSSGGEIVSANVSVMPLNNNAYIAPAATDANTGAFSMANLEPGQYIIYASPVAVKNIAAAYYKENDVAVFDKSLATVITVNETGTNDANYVITLPVRDPSNTFYGVNGVIMDENYQPLTGVKISVYGELNEKTEPVLTDEKGWFSVKVELTNSMEKFALTASKDGYNVENYSFVLDDNNPSQSIKLVMQKIVIPKVYDNEIKGIVKTSDGTLLFAQISAFKVETNEKGTFYSPNKYDYTSKENTGVFSLTNLEPGDYILLATPYSIASGYYKENGTAVIDQNQATVITVTENSVNESDYVITLNNEPLPPIMFGIYGSVTDNNNQPLSGVKIVIIDEKGQQVTFDKDIITNDYGIFEIKLEAGAYILSASKDGYADYSIQLKTGDRNSLDEKVLIVMVPKGQDGGKVAAGVNDNIINNSAITIYPNPVSDNLNIELNNCSGHIEISIIDVLGNKLITKSYDSDNSSFITNLDLSGLSPGNYMIKISNNSLLKIGKFIKR